MITGAATSAGLTWICNEAEPVPAEFEAPIWTENVPACVGVPEILADWIVKPAGSAEALKDVGELLALIV